MKTMLRQEGTPDPGYVAVPGVDAPVPVAQTVAWVRFQPWSQAKAAAGARGAEDV